MSARDERRLHTTRVTIDRLALTLHGVSAEIAQSALVGLDEMLAQRLNVRALDATRWRETGTLRVPAMHISSAVDAATLRGMIADGLCALLQTSATPPTAATPTTEAE